MGTSLEEYMANRYATKEKKIKQVDREQLEDTNDNKKILPTTKTEQYNTTDHNKLSLKPLPTERDRTQSETENTDVTATGSSGLLLNKDVAEEMKIKEEQMRKELQRLKGLSKNDKVIHRDALGNIISEEEARIEKDKKRLNRKRDIEHEECIAKRNKNEAGIEKERQMRERLQEIRGEGINAYENNEKLIKIQKEQIKEEDPALLFNKKIIEKHKKRVDKRFISVTGRKLYNNPTRYPANRFDIKPGWRWDGIVRGNGYEQKWFHENSK